MVDRKKSTKRKEPTKHRPIPIVDGVAYAAMPVPDLDRFWAAALVHRYRERDKLRRFKLDEGQVVDFSLTGDDLADALDWFAKHGTFGVPDKRMRDYVYRTEYEFARSRLKEEGCRNPATEAIKAVMDQWEVSDQTVRDAIYRRKTKSRT